MVIYLLRLVRFERLVRLVRFERLVRLVRFERLVRLVRFERLVRLVRFERLVRLVFLERFPPMKLEVDGGGVPPGDGEMGESIGVGFVCVSSGDFLL